MPTNHDLVERLREELKYGTHPWCVWTDRTLLSQAADEIERLRVEAKLRRAEMKVLVTGGRDYSDILRLYQVLDVLHEERGISLIIEGGASGADSLAGAWAVSRGVEAVECKAEWRAYGKAAGPIRNQRMIELRPDLVVAFPGGRGTADMLRRARTAGIEVKEVDP